MVTIRQITAMSFVATVVLFAGRVSAQSAAPTGDRGGIQLGLRLGYGLPFGDTGRTPTDVGDDKLSETIKGQIPIVFDAGYLINPNVYAGLSFQYGFGFVGTESSTAGCDQPQISCSTSDVRLGVNFQFHLNPTESFDPWVGLGAGYEWLSVSISGPGGSASAGGSGFEFANLQLGGDFKLAPDLAVGPFVSLSVGQYSTTFLTVNNITMSQDVTDKSFHEWLLFGVRGVYTIRL